MITAGTEISTSFTSKNNLFPVFLKLEELKLLIVGGGKIGLEKLSAVLKNSPQTKIHIVAPEIKNEILSLAVKYKNINIIKRVFLPEDLKDKDLVIAATNNSRLNCFVKEEAKAKGILTNVADTPNLCDFYLSSIVQKGSIKLAISTNGKSPTIAKRLREVFEKAIPDELESSLDDLVKIRKNLNGDFTKKVKELNRITSVLAVKEQAKTKIKLKSILTGIFSAIILMITGHLILQNILPGFFESVIDNLLLNLNVNFLWFILVGFIAQMIDGILGMAYGVSATTFLLALGIAPAAASASVHTSEIFTSGASGLMHLKFGNVNKNLFKKLLLPGVAGSILGAYVLTSLSAYASIVKIFVAFYTLLLGVIIIFKAFNYKKEKKVLKHITPLASLGGFLDSAGGGGWGPVVASTLIARGNHPKETIGSVNLAEFFVTLSSSAAFIIFIGSIHYKIILGLIIGGIIAAPFAAKITGKIPIKAMMISIGILVIVLSLRNILF